MKSLKKIFRRYRANAIISTNVLGQLAGLSDGKTPGHLLEVVPSTMI